MGYLRPLKGLVPQDWRNRGGLLAPKIYTLEGLREPMCLRKWALLTRQALGVCATHEPLGGGHKVAPLCFSRNISATQRRRDAKLCTHLPEYLAQVVCKFGVDRIQRDVTVTS